METETKFQKLPNGMQNFHVGVRDIIVYLFLRSHEDYNTHSTFVSLDTIAKETGISKPTVIKCIKNLILDNYITVEKRNNKSNIYHFVDPGRFERFSQEFLNNQDLTIEEKGYLAIVQQYMRRDDGQSGIISMRDSDLSNLTRISERSIQRYNHALEEKGYLTIANSSLPDIIENSGCLRKIKCFDLVAYGQAIAFALKNHETRISQMEAKQRETDNQMFTMQEELRSLKLEQEILRNQNKDIINENLALKKTNQQLKNALNLKLYKNAHQVAL